ncbi:MFS transporter [Cryptosporangium phraense]|uniref:MFS transporter n=1 Tax=Cryptosporangium phraense TaxID=2593070 RepID=A0A545AJL1_9ACTN|nr:MFS transporter [Cryptosporangium phraense]
MGGLLRRADFRRLFGVRLTGQFGDGVFQAALAGSVLFNPDRQTEPVAVAFGFAVLLLPYSLLGPFTGILLDRYPRRNVLVWANVTRSVVLVGVAAVLWAGGRTWPFLLLALIAVAVNRFILGGLSAGMPHVARNRELITANAFSPTAGTVVLTIGVGAAVGLRSVVDAGDLGYAVVLLVASAAYLISAVLAGRFPVAALGPDRDDPTARLETVGSVVRGMVAGVRHLSERRAAAFALLTVGLGRIGFGVTTLALLLLYRNTLDGGGMFPSGDTGLGQVVLATGLGAGLAALVTPGVVRRISRRTWMTALLILLAVVWPVIVAVPTTAVVVAVALVGGWASQGIKIIVDAAVQSEVDDVYRGRVFALYDMLFNVCVVTGLLIAAFGLPDSGRSWPVFLGLGVGHLVLAAWVARWTDRLGWSRVSAVTPPARVFFDSSGREPGPD